MRSRTDEAIRERLIYYNRIKKTWLRSQATNVGRVNRINTFKLWAKSEISLFCKKGESSCRSEPHVAHAESE